LICLDGKFYIKNCPLLLSVYLYHYYVVDKIINLNLNLLSYIIRISHEAIKKICHIVDPVVISRQLVTRGGAHSKFHIKNAMAAAKKGE
jgi:hypothetical protein